MKKELVLHSVKHSVSSIFTKEDVINLINSIEAGSSRKITTEDIERAIDETINWIDNNEREIVDLDSAEFELTYNNQIECVGVPISSESIREVLENNFMDFGEVEDDEIEIIEVIEAIANNEL
jgi:cell division ATPase FtsA